MNLNEKRFGGFVVFTTILAFLMFTTGVQAGDFQKPVSTNSWHAQELPKEDNTIPYVLLGAAVTALVIGIIVNASKSDTTAQPRLTDIRNGEAARDSAAQHTSKPDSESR